MRVTNIDTKKSTILITLDDGSRHEFVKEIQAEFYLYVNKDLSAQELTAISDYSNMNKHYQYCLRILAKGAYPIYDIKTKLTKREASPQVIDQIITRLVDNNLLNDKNYALIMFNHYFNQGFGPSYIKRKMEAKRISDDLITEFVVIDTDTQIEHALKMANSFAKRQKNIAKSALLNKIYSKLTRDGYSPAIVINVVEILKETLIDNDEALIKIEFAKMSSRLKNKISDKDDLEETLIKKLTQKGYRYSAIRKYIEEQKNVY